MFVGVSRIDIFIPESRSLKAKRQVIRPAISAVRNQLNVAIAEVDHQDLWQRAALGVSCVSESTGQCRKVIQDVEKIISRTVIGTAEIVGRSTEVVAMEDLV